MLINYKQVTTTPIITTPTGYNFIDDALGGGLIRGQMLGLSGDAGAGKSTLATQLSIILANKQKKVMYMTGEEAPGKQKKRIERLDNILEYKQNIDYFTPNKDGHCYIEDIISVHQEHQHDYIFIDSLQELASKDSNGKYKTIYIALNKLYVYLQNNPSLTVIVIIQSTKNGSYAGSKQIKHKLDTMIFIDTFINKIDNSITGRQVRYSKNRDGAIGRPYPVTLTKGGLSDFIIHEIPEETEEDSINMLSIAPLGILKSQKTSIFQKLLFFLKHI